MINYPVANLNAGDITALEIDTIKSIGFYKKNTSHSTRKIFV